MPRNITIKNFLWLCFTISNSSHKDRLYPSLIIKYQQMQFKDYEPKHNQNGFKGASRKADIKLSQRAVYVRLILTRHEYMSS